MSLQAFLLVSLIAAQTVAQAQIFDSFQISVDVELVVLQAVVRDSKGTVAPDLVQQDFHIYEDGVPQSIHLFRHDDTPVTVGLVIDHSGSMRPKLAHVVEAVRTFAHSSNPEDQMFVVNFNEKVSLGLAPASPFTNRADDLEGAISGMRADGQTSLYDAVAVGLDRLALGTRQKKVLIVVSDGDDNASALSLPGVMKKAEASGALIYTIGIFNDNDEDKNPGVLTRLARATGGDAFFPTELPHVISICDEIARDIRRQYTLGYVSSNVSRPGVFHRIKVTARAKGHGTLIVRTRPGYTK